MAASAGDDRTLVVRLVPVGPLPPGFASQLAAFLSRRVNAPVAIEEATGAVDLTRLTGRDQVDADRLLRYLERLEAPAETVWVGVSALDMAIPIFTFVFGLARQSGRAAVVSAARLAPEFYGLPPDPILTLHRTVVEILHEMGHVAGLEHCRDAACLMRFAGSVDQIDVRGSVFCDACAARLPRWLRAQFPASR